MCYRRHPEHADRRVRGQRGLEELEDEVQRHGYEYDTEMTASEWQHVVHLYKAVLEEELGESSATRRCSSGALSALCFRAG